MAKNPFFTSSSDGAIGHWLDDTPYIELEKGRDYVHVPPKILKDLSGCDPQVKKYFGQTKFKKELSAYLKTNGRTFWGNPKDFPKDPKIIPGVVSEPSLQKIPPKIRDLDVSSLICGVDLAEPWDHHGCTLYGRKIAHSLIKVAATRIFANPAQSVMEPIANSIDAYFPERRIGKFGMGFFSMLYWLISTPQARLEITSYIPGESYVATLRFEGTLLLDLDILEDSRVGTTGTRISLVSNMQDYNRDIDGYVRRFREVENIDLVIQNFYKLKPEKSNGFFSKKGKLIGFRHNKDGKSKLTFLDFEDFAIGVSLKVLFSSLLVPSISTKKIIGGGPKTSKARPSRVNVTKGSDHHFLITVGDVIIFEDRVFEFSKSESRLTAILSLSPNTKLPVSRDDFIVDEESRNEVINGIQVIAPYFENLEILETLIGKYNSQTTSLTNRDLMEEALSIYRDKLKILVPGEWMWLYKNIDESVVGTSHYSVLKLEKWLEKSYVSPGNIWNGVKVIFYSIPGREEITFGGTNIFLFVPEKLRVVSGWQSRIEASFTERRLVPFSEDPQVRTEGSQYGIPLSISDVDLATLTALIGAIKAKDIWYQFPDNWKKDIYSFAAKILNEYHDYYHIVMSALIARISNATPEYIYGGGKKYLYLYADTASLKDYFPNFNKEVTSLAIDDFLWKARNDNPQNLETVIPTRALLFSTDTSIKIPKSFLTVVLANWIKYRISDFGHAKEDTEAAFSKMLRQLYQDISVHVPSFFERKVLLINFLNRAEAWYYPTTDIGELDAIVAKQKVILAGLLREGSDFDTTSLVTGQPIILGNFNTSALIDTIFRIPYNGLVFYSKVKPSDPPLKFQIFSIAVNEATTKAYEEAVVTETFQNSVDAIRGTGSVGTIDFKVSLDPRDRRKLIYSIYDPIGMTEEQFFHIGIPFLSSKTASELQTGEMGTGFFNVYREAYRVKIETSINPSEGLMSIDTPVRSEGRVNDLQRTVYKTTNRKKGTLITVFIEKSTPEKALDSVGAFKAFIEGVVRASPLKDISMTINGEEIPKFSGKLMFETEYYEIYYSEKDQLAPQLTTKGIPAGSFLPFLGYVQSANTFFGITVNLKNKAYTPVHSRSKVNLSKEVGGFVEQTKFLAALRLQELYAELLNHTLSRASITQLKLTGSSLNYWTFIKDFKTYPFQGTKKASKKPKKKESDEQPSKVTLIGLVNGLIDEYGDEVPGPIIANEIEYWRDHPKAKKWISKITNDNLRPRIVKILIDWFEPKNHKSSTKAKNKKDKPKEKEVKVPEIVSKFIKVFCVVYTEFLSKYFTVKKDLEINVKQMLEDDPLGHYIPSSNTIEFFIYSDDMEIAKKFVESFMRAKDSNKASLELASSDKDFWDKYITSGDAVLSHELEHYRRETAHSDAGAHVSIKENLFGVTKERSFASSHLEIRSKFIADGFWDQVKKRMG